MECAFVRKRLLCALKSFKIGFIGVPSNIFLRNLCSLDICSQVVHVYGKQRAFYPPVFLGFSYSHRTI